MAAANLFWSARALCLLAAIIAGAYMFAGQLPAGAQSPAPGQQPIVLSVIVRDALPGFRRQDAADYFVHQMSAAGTHDWAFTTAAPGTLPPPNRVEWRFELDPYATGGVRQFFPMPQVQRLFGPRHLITAEAMLYLDNEYQTLMFGQAAIQGGAQDADLAAFVTRMTDGLLGDHGAYRAIDIGPPSIAGASTQ